MVQLTHLVPASVPLPVSPPAASPCTCVHCRHCRCSRVALTTCVAHAMQEARANLLHPSSQLYLQKPCQSLLFRISHLTSLLLVIWPIRVLCTLQSPQQPQLPCPLQTLLESPNMPLLQQPPPAPPHLWAQHRSSSRRRQFIWCVMWWPVCRGQIFNRGSEQVFPSYVMQCWLPFPCEGGV